MNNRIQIRLAKKVLSALTAKTIVDATRSVIADLEKPELQNAPLIPTATGVWLTTAEVKAEFPDYTSNKIVIENIAAVYVGRMSHKMLATVGLNPATLSRDQMADVFAVTDAAEREAVRRMTTN